MSKQTAANVILISHISKKSCTIELLHFYSYYAIFHLCEFSLVPKCAYLEDPLYIYMLVHIINQYISLLFYKTRWVVCLPVFAMLLILPYPYYCNACVSNECSLSIKNGGEKKHTRPFCSNKHRPFDCSGRVARSNEIRAAIGLTRLTSSNPNTRKGLTKHICHRHKSLL